MYSRILVPLDGSDLAEQVLPHVVQLSTALGLAVALVRVTPTEESYSRYLEYSVGAFQHLSLDPDEEAPAYLEKVAECLSQQGVESVQKKLLYGDPAAKIIDLAQKTPSTMVTMTTHGRSGFGCWFLGSVADRVVRHSEFPVLVIRAKECSRV